MSAQMPRLVSEHEFRIPQSCLQLCTKIVLLTCNHHVKEYGAIALVHTAVQLHPPSGRRWLAGSVVWARCTLVTAKYTLYTAIPESVLCWQDIMRAYYYACSRLGWSAIEEYK